jgi:hypothetical protein
MHIYIYTYIYIYIHIYVYVFSFFLNILCCSVLSQFIRFDVCVCVCVCFVCVSPFVLVKSPSNCNEGFLLIFVASFSFFLFFLEAYCSGSGRCAHMMQQVYRTKVSN